MTWIIAVKSSDKFSNAMTILGDSYRSMVEESNPQQVSFSDTVIKILYLEQCLIEDLKYNILRRGLERRG